MTATVLFFEMLVIGFHTLVVFILIVGDLFGWNQLAVFVHLTAFGDATLVAFFTVLSYSFGVIADRAYLPIWAIIDGKTRAKLKLSLDNYYRYQALVTIKGNSEIHSLLTFHTSRLRIARSSMVNWFLTGFFLGRLFFYLGKQSLGISAILLGVGLAFFSYMAYANINERQYKLVIQAAKVVSK